MLCARATDSPLLSAPRGVLQLQLLTHRFCRSKTSANISLNHLRCCCCCCSSECLSSGCTPWGWEILRQGCAIVVSYWNAPWMRLQFGIRAALHTPGEAFFVSRFLVLPLFLFSYWHISRINASASQWINLRQESEFNLCNEMVVWVGNWNSRNCELNPCQFTWPRNCECYS